MPFEDYGMHAWIIPIPNVKYSINFIMLHFNNGSLECIINTCPLENLTSQSFCLVNFLRALYLIYINKKNENAINVTNTGDIIS